MQYNAYVLNTHHLSCLHILPETGFPMQFQQSLTVLALLSHQTCSGCLPEPYLCVDW